ncbi:hypothetical protein [Viridibacterium curvum]|uniref:PEP-CTERM protein-sorting domain-containing protein n=1 Tax=Viridibacterium curvum TaxID=1101404 RepID=A0ABP9QQ66_9RHOO
MNKKIFLAAIVAAVSASLANTANAVGTDVVSGSENILGHYYVPNLGASSAVYGTDVSAFADKCDAQSMLLCQTSGGYVDGYHVAGNVSSNTLFVGAASGFGGLEASLGGPSYSGSRYYATVLNDGATSKSYGFNFSLTGALILDFVGSGEPSFVDQQILINVNGSNVWNSSHRLSGNGATAPELAALGDQPVDPLTAIYAGTPAAGKTVFTLNYTGYVELATLAPGESFTFEYAVLSNAGVYPLGYNYNELEGNAGGAVSLLSSSFGITTAVPESSGLAMLLAGFGLLGLMARRRLG